MHTVWPNTIATMLAPSPLIVGLGIMLSASPQTLIVTNACHEGAAVHSKVQSHMLWIWCPAENCRFGAQNEIDLSAGLYAYSLCPHMTWIVQENRNQEAQCYPTSHKPPQSIKIKIQKLKIFWLSHDAYRSGSGSSIWTWLFIICHHYYRLHGGREFRRCSCDGELNYLNCN